MADPTRLLYRADDISCDHCRRAIETAVGAVEGVESVSVDVGARTVDVSVAGPEVEAAVRGAIEDAGYPISEKLEHD